MLELKESALSTIDYKLVGAYPIENTYIDLCEGDAILNKINTSELVGFPNCPWGGIGSKFGFGERNININKTRG